MRSVTIYAICAALLYIGAAPQNTGATASVSQKGGKDKAASAYHIFFPRFKSRRRLSASLAALASSISRMARRRRLKSLLGLTSSRQSISPRSSPRIITSADAIFVATGTLWISQRRRRSSAISFVEDSIEESRKKITTSTSSYETRDDIC